MKLIDTRISTNNIVVTDTETGGLYPTTNALLEVAFVHFEDAIPPLRIYVNDLHYGQVDQRALKVNGINLDDIRERGFYPAHAMMEIERWFTNLRRAVPNNPFTLAGHNVAFDDAFLSRIFPARKPWSHRTIDTHTLLFAMVARQRIRQPTPEESMSTFGFTALGVSPPEEARHTALGDALATRDMLRGLLDMIGDG
jgi:DNA polymerase-3 subunit epsilon